VLTTPVVRSVLLVMAMARSRARFFRIDSAFPASAPGRRHIGPFEACSSFTRVTACQVARPPFCGLCREVPTRPVSQPNRSPAIESNHQLFEWVLPPLVICPFRAHAEACPTLIVTQFSETPKSQKRVSTGCSLFQSESEPEIDVYRDEGGTAFACSPFPSYQGGASERPGAVKGAPLLRGEANP
jgi:hypothetical protein